MRRGQLKDSVQWCRENMFVGFQVGPSWLLLEPSQLSGSWSWWGWGITQGWVERNYNECSFLIFSFSTPCEISSSIPNLRRKKQTNKKNHQAINENQPHNGSFIMTLWEALLWSRSIGGESAEFERLIQQPKAHSWQVAVPSWNPGLSATSVFYNLGVFMPALFPSPCTSA